MLKPLFLLLCSCASLFVYSQEFRYSFSGKLTDNELSRLNDSLERYPFLSYNIQFKSFPEFGELIFHVKVPENSDSPPSISLVDIKKILLDVGLFPLNCVVISTSKEP
jgi:hypothetical protein